MNTMVQEVKVIDFGIEVDRIRQGYYSDDYFLNTVKILKELAEQKYVFQGENIYNLPVEQFENGNIIVEQQYFTRRKPFTVVGGIQECLAVLRECTGYYDEEGNFVNTFDQMEVLAIEDGEIVHYDGEPKHVKPVLKIRGCYRDFAHLETVLLGILSETSRIATNVYNAFVATRGKNIKFFPARFGYYKTQQLQGYAYYLGAQAFNRVYNANVKPLVSTAAQTEYWGGTAGGTISHATIFAFLGDTAETMVQYAEHIDPAKPRIALVDFHNDCVGDTLKVMKAFFPKYLEHYKNNNEEGMKRYTLTAVRPDTSGNMIDKSLTPTGDKKQDTGVNPRLVWNLRNAIDNAYLNWDIPVEYVEVAKKWCENIEITVTGGFNEEKINWFEKENVPVNDYGIGSSLLDNSKETNNDFTADNVRVKIGDTWYNLAKEGRCACENQNLKIVK